MCFFKRLHGLPDRAERPCSTCKYLLGLTQFRAQLIGVWL